MAIPAPVLHYRFQALQSATDVRANKTLTGGSPTFGADGLIVATNDFKVSVLDLLPGTVPYSLTAVTIYIRGKVTSTASQQFFCELWSDSSSRIALGTTATGTTANFLAFEASTQAQLTAASGIAAATEFLFAGAAAVNDFEASLAGASIGTDTSGVMPVIGTANLEMYVGLNAADTVPMTGTIAELAVFNTRLAIADMNALTAGTAQIPLPLTGSSGIGFMSKFGFR